MQNLKNGTPDYWESKDDGGREVRLGRWGRRWVEVEEGRRVRNANGKNKLKKTRKMAWSLMVRGPPICEFG